MSQKLTGDDAQKGFAVGRGLLAAAETLNFSMGETHSDPYGSSSQSHGGMSGLVGGEGKDHDSQLSRRAGSHISNTMKLFASLGLSPTDLDALAQVPEENISVETLPHLIMQLKNRKMEAGRRMGGDMSTLSSETSYRGGRDDWSGSQGGRLDRSGGQSQSRSQSDFGYTSMQETSGRGYDMLDYSSGSGRDRQYSDLSHDSYRSLGMSTSSTSDDMFMQRRMGTPSQGKVQDFLGVMPIMFPHVCSLCDFDVHSVMEWTQHTNGIRHSENRRLLLQMYPDWDPQLPSSRKSTSLSLDTKSRSDGLLGAAPIGASLQRTGMSSSWGSDSSMGMTSKMTSYSSAPPKIRSRVVVAKYERKPMSPNSLFALAKPFGTICEHLILKNKAFLEMQTHEEALAMANYYQRKPAILHGKEIHIYLSKELMAIEKSGRPDRETRPIKRAVSQVVFFSNLPRGGEKKMELLTIARRFGTVEKHLFLNDEAFIQLSNPEDAEMLVKYYTLNPLTINRRNIRLNICTKYKTLTVPPGKGDQPREAPPRKSSTSSSTTSRTADKPSSKSQRSSSTSKSKEGSDEKEEPKAEEAEAVGDGSGDEDADVMEARDGDEEGFEEADADDVELSGDPEQTGEQQEDIDDTNVEEEEEEVEEEEEDPDAEQARDASYEAETAENQEDADEKQEETELEEPAASEAEQEENASDLPKEHEEQNEEQAEDEGAEEDSAEQESQNETDFPENIDEFVTLDELAEEEDAEKQDSKSKSRSTSGSSKDSGGLRVVNVIGFKRGYGYLDEVLALAKPFGKVVRHLVLDVRPEAFLELSSEQEARAMASFYSGNVMPSVCGKPVKVYHSHTYPTIQSGRVLYIRNIPPFKGSDALILKIAEPFGKVKRYYLNRIRNECFIEMERWEDAEKMAEAYKENRPKFEGKRLLVYVSRKYKQLKNGHRPPVPEPEDKRPLKRERSGESETQSSSSGKSKDKKEEEPSVKKMKVDEPVTVKAEEQEEKESHNVSAETVPEVKSGPEEEQIKDSSEHHNMETESHQDEETGATPPVVESEKSVKTEEKPITAAPETKLETSHATLEPYDPNVPVGVEFVKMGYYCRVCFLFYSNEDTAKKIHCSSQAHYDKLKKYLEKEKAKAQSNGGKK
ncbi:matrin 3-like 1.2 isoform X2 [Labeo rohita]|uniref:matrin 3-like 1.2 isoform X2 n=1 Tax=Labeo rohita TaxID=84645 RepID=UPI0021E317DE|nr:matrin 3-like 1.2 isoform X2 [Labeo rohita]